MSDVNLTSEEQGMLAGDEGPGVKRAMEIVVALARIYGAADLVPVTHAQIAGVSYKNLGDAGVEFLNRWADEGAKVRVPTTLNPMGMERGKWQQWGISTDFAVPQLSVIDAFAKMGVTPTMSCTPYLFREYTPKRGDVLAWAESSAVAFANSVIGARSNREGGPSAIAAAVTGRTARYGYHLDENRRATHIVEVRCPVKSVADFGALSYTVGKAVGNGVPWFADLAAWLPPLPSDWHVGGPAGDRLKTLGAGLAAYGAVALYHVAGYHARGARPGRDADPARRAAAGHRKPGRCLPRHGCRSRSAPDRSGDGRLPACQPDRDRAGGRHSAWQAAGDAAVGDDRRDHPPGRGRAGLRAGDRGGRRRGRGRHVRGRRAHADAEDRSMATNAGKMACYAPMHSGVRMRFGDLEQCLDAAVTGEWRAELE